MATVNRSNHRRRRGSRSLKRGLMSIVLAPGRLPRIAGEPFSKLMRSCERVAILFVAVLFLHMVAPEHVAILPVMIIGLIFGALLFLIALSDYQDKLAEYDLYGFRI